MTRTVPLDNTRQVIVDDDDEIDFRQSIAVLSKYKRSIFGLTFAISLLTILIVFSIEPSYQATATVLIESQGENIVSIEEIYGISGATDEYFETQNQILQSRDLAERVIRELNLEKHRDFDPMAEQSGFSIDPRTWRPKDWLSDSDPMSEQDIRNAVVGSFQLQLTVSPIRNSRLINISFESHDRNLVASIPNTLASAYIDSDLEGRLGMTEKAAGWITERLDSLRENLLTSEKALQSYRDQENLVDVKGIDSLTAQELNEITRDMVSARRSRSEAEELYRQVNALKGQPSTVYESIPAVLSAESVNQAKDAQSETQRKLSELAKRYGPKHPKMIAAVNELASADDNVAAQVMNVVDSIYNQYQSAVAQERGLNRDMKSAEANMTDLNRQQGALQALERDVQTNRQLYDMFLTREKETTVAGDLQTAVARVVDPSVVPTKPYKPQKLLILVIVIFISLTGGMILAFLIESMDNTIADTQDIERKLAVPALGILPKISKWSEAGHNQNLLRFYTRNTETGYAENIRTIRTGVLLTAIDEAKKVILVTSSIPNEGKSAMSVNLAMSLAQLGKVLLIDADLRRPSIAKIFSIDKSQGGMSQFVTGSLELQQCIHHFKDENLYVMPAGIIPPNPLELLSSDRFSAGIEKLKASFDHVVIDSAPIIAVSDSVVLSHHVNSVVYIIKANETPFQLAQDGLKKLRHVDAPITGVVLNQVVPLNKPGRYGYYSGDYYKYYGYSQS